jgi:hypothetical protein
MKVQTQPAAMEVPKRGAGTRDQVARQVAGMDTIEVKATIPDAQIEKALLRYNLTVDNDEERYIYFFDTPQLDLLKAGVIARARRNVGKQHDTTVKFRPVVPSEVFKDWIKFEGFKLEADASEKGVVRSASLTMPVEKGLIKRVAAGKNGIGALFCKEQVEFLAAVGGQKVAFDTLIVYGPLQAHRWGFMDPACPWRITAELWRREDGAHLMEVSIKSPAVQAAVAIAGFMALLAEVGAEEDLEQQTKTRWALVHPASGARNEATTDAGSSARASDPAVIRPTDLPTSSPAASGGGPSRRERRRT